VALTAKIPPGRAGRIWLRRRLAAAERGREQLDRKLRVLVVEQAKLRAVAESYRRQWVGACGEGSDWLLRAALLGGEDALRQATPREPVTVRVTWTNTVGVRHPRDVAILGDIDAVTAGLGNAALAPAIRAFEQAMTAGVRTAAADEAVRRVGTEIAVTRRRMRALDKRWLPWLREALAERELVLEQAEQEDGVRLRRAVGDPTGPGTRVR
jgi:V/A-type H+/Na+-transporting ATPase subunit D